MRPLLQVTLRSTVSTVTHTHTQTRTHLGVRPLLQVTLRSTVSTVVVTTLVLEGWSSKLNPELRILDHVRDMLLVDWNERMSRTVDKVMKGGSLAVA